MGTETLRQQAEAVVLDYYGRAFSEAVPLPRALERIAADMFTWGEITSPRANIVREALQHLEKTGAI